MSILCLSLLLTGCQPRNYNHETRRSAHNNIWFVQEQRVHDYISEYSKTNRVELLWDRSEPYRPYIFKVFKEYGLPNELGLLPMVESSFNPKARSARAVGLWQFTLASGRDMGLRIDKQVDERLDWRKSTIAAAKYLKKLSQQFDGNWSLVLAAYNNGPGVIADAVEFQGTNNYWHMTLRDETMNYVPKFLAMIHILRNGAS